MSASVDRSTNHLAHETSPYLLQHVHNPVDWHPWGAEALELARTLDRPIFLSIGYSACHWCHVMERESFENPEIAALLNQWFVNIKVDREERPDLDQIYMNAVTALTGSGGWPMSVFLTPDLQPFFGGTYWPPEARWGRPGFREILTAVQEAWTGRREALVRQARELTDIVAQSGRPSPPTERLSAATLENALRVLLRAADPVHGGFGQAPKFPHSLDLRVLLRCHRRFGDASALDTVVLTLDKMARGGIYDHLGGGFARYSTDARWLVPHFEKMLYDNALLVPAYLEAHQVTGRADFATVARETLDYVLREMTHPQGGFYSTQDADSEGVEGKFFVWSEGEIVATLGHDDARVFNHCYGVTAAGNWEHQNILHRPQTTAQAAAALGLSPAAVDEILQRSRARLFARRSQRVWPGRDEKILASWNGLMIAAFAQGANVLGERRYAAAAAAAADFVLREMRAPDGRLWHAYKDGRARFNAYLDDYAALIDGLVELYQATFEPRYVAAAVELAERMWAQFWDAEDAGFFYTSADHEALIARNKDTYDNATPAGNSLAATALLKLGRLTGRADLEQAGVATLEMMAGTLARAATAAGQSLLALDYLLGPSSELVLCDGGAPAGGDEALRQLHRRFVPNKLVVRSATGAPPTDLLPLLAGKTAVDGEPTVYVCEGSTCRPPLVGVAAIGAGWERLR